MLESIDRIAALRDRLDSHRRAGLTIGLVPTMGALHAGHGALIDRARDECDLIAVSIFVNPLQFDRPDDLAAYPRTFDSDLAICRDRGVDLVFAPSPEEIYPEPPVCTVDVGPLADHLCGKFRPGHFRGVATVVLKLLAIVQPQRVYFGEKDAQQLAIIKRLVTDFNMRVQVVEVGTVREADGLAMSSRNRRLTSAQRPRALQLHQALRTAEQLIKDGERDARYVVATASSIVPAQSDVKLEYLEVVDPETLQPVDVISRDVRVAGALWVGDVRLIDNLLVTLRRASPSPPEAASSA